MTSYVKNRASYQKDIVSKCFSITEDLYADECCLKVKCLKKDFVMKLKKNCYIMAPNDFRKR